MAIPLHIPGICAILGAQGSGKSYSALKIGLQYCEQIEYDLCTNFPLDYHRLYDYCLENQYYWLCKRIWNNKVQFREAENLEEFCVFPKTLHLLDEAGIYVNSRDFKSLGKSFVQNLAQIRHDAKLLWWIAQYHDMVDKNFRELTMTFIKCESETRMNKKLGNYELYKESIWMFYSREFKIYCGKVEDKLRGMKYYINTKRLANRHWAGKLNRVDKMLFEIYQSYGSKVGDEIDYDEFKFFKKSYQEVNYFDFNYEIERDYIEERKTAINDFIEIFLKLTTTLIYWRIKNETQKFNTNLLI